MVRDLPVLPEFTPGELTWPPVPIFSFDRSLADELKARRITKKRALQLLECMLSIREFEQMIVALRSQAYEPLRPLNFQYRGPTHVSIGQEATAAGACAAIGLDDLITSTHRGHGDGIAKGFLGMFERDAKSLRAWVGPDAKGLKGDALLEKALEEHVFRTAAELFGKDEGYCRGRGGGMHIADFSSGHLGANAIVGGSVPIATGAGYSLRYFEKDHVVVCFAGDGAYANGVVLESLNMAAMDQFTNQLADKPRGVPIVFLVVNNQYGMTGQQRNEVTGIDYVARRAAGFHRENMHAEVVNGMDVLAVLDATRRAVKLARNGKGPVLLELICYRYHGHSLSDPRNEYRTREEEAAWRAVDPVDNLAGQIVKTKTASKKQVDELRVRVRERQARAAVRAAKAPDPAPEDVCKFVFIDPDSQPASTEHDPGSTVGAVEKAKRKDGKLSFKEAIREAILEEMADDERVVVYGEDVADYGGAFKVTKGLLEMFGRRRVFNTSISEAAIIGTGVGAAMTGLRPVVELMYSDFEFQAGDQIFNQAAKWHYMSGGKVRVPLVIRSATGAGKGYGGQHSQSLESHAAHTPGIIVAVPSTPYDAKGLLKTAIRDDNPVIFVESQGLYNELAQVPEDPYTVPFGEAAIRTEGADATLVAWGYVAHLAVQAAAVLRSKHDIALEVIDPRTLIPLDIETILASVRKTGRVIVASQASRTGSYTAEVASQIQELAFDWLDAPVARIGARDAISPQSEVLEKAYLPGVADIVESVRNLLA
jgi:2-oxoisovalerate dehydrogenase E1 component